MNIFRGFLVLLFASLASASQAQTTGPLLIQRQLGEIAALGATAQGNARANLSLGSISLQDAAHVAITGGIISGTLLNVLPTGASVARNMQDVLVDTINVKNFGIGGVGAKGDFTTFQNATMLPGSGVLTLANAQLPFSASDVGTKRAVVTGALGISAPPLSGLIISYQSATQVTLGTLATHDTRNYFLAETLTVPITGTAGNYVQGDIMDCTGATPVASTICQVKVYNTGIRAFNSIVSAGSGGSGGTCTLQTVGGTGNPAILRFSLSGGSITGSPTITSAGQFFVNPPDLANIALQAIRGCTVTGAVISASFGGTQLVVQTLGEYSPLPTTDMTTGPGSISGATGLTFTGNWVRTGQGGWGTDDTAAFTAAINKMEANNTAGRKTALYIPSGNYFLNGGTGPAVLPTCITNCGFFGDSIGQSAITAGPDYPAPASILSWFNSWGGQDTPRTGPSIDWNGGSIGALVHDLNFIGFSGVANPAHPITFYGRTSGAEIFNIQAWYTGSCFRGGLLSPTGYPAANFQEADIYSYRCQGTGTTTDPAFWITANTTGSATTAMPNNLNLNMINIYGSRGPSMAIDGLGTGVKFAGNVKLDNIRIEAIPRRSSIGAGDLLRIGNAAATYGSREITGTNIYLIGVVADPSTSNYYCALRITNSDTQNVDLKNLQFISANGGSNAICIDAGHDIKLEVAKLTSALYEVSVGASPGVGQNIYIDVLDQVNPIIPYQWNIGSGAKVKTNVLSEANVIQLAAVPTGYYSFAGRLTGNTDLIFPQSGTLATTDQAGGAWRILGSAKAVDFTQANVDTPIALTWAGRGWVNPGVSDTAARSLGSVWVSGCDAVPLAAAGTAYTQAGGAGVLLGATTDNYTSATASNRVVRNPATAPAIFTIFTAPIAYFRLTTPNVASLHCNVDIVGVVLPALP